MSSDETVEETNGDSFGKVKQRFKDRSQKVVQTKAIMSKKAVQTKEMLSKQAVKIAKQAEEHERFINKVTHLLGVLGFGGFCFLLGARPHDIHYVYCLFYIIFVPLRWIYYRFKKWHYYLLVKSSEELLSSRWLSRMLNVGLPFSLFLPRPREEHLYLCNLKYLPAMFTLLKFLPCPRKMTSEKSEMYALVCQDFCYYANTIFLVDPLMYPKNEKLFMVCFSFAEGPLAWALIVWRCSLVFNSVDKIVSVLIHLLPESFAAMHPEGSSRRASWPYVEDKSYLLTWLFLIPLGAYTLWQVLYFLIVNVLRRQRLVRDPEVMTSYRELSKKAQKANNIWWRLSGLLGDQNRMFMYIAFQAIFTVATMALTVPIFLSYKLHVIFQILKISAAIWNGGSFLLEVMPKQVILKEKKKAEIQPAQPQRPQDQSLVLMENSIETNRSTEAS
ncbi:glycerophosphocholine acyltransferase 1 [Citrus sinensis]|uniref:Glycerophosphocholine acyltransferase 1 n=1 Tax=Citrus sinensis TaxID=2711 RepID=A0ACB8NV20_CITSI|nr:glycerophosphocholine acyltransferase 1 [Citrus sinensis]